MTIRHGTDAGRQQHLARGEQPCNACREAGNAQVRAARKRGREAGLAPDDHRHGTTTGYSAYGCRCELCRQAGRDYRAGVRGDRTAVISVAPALRSVRVSAAVWEAAKAVAAERGETMPGVIEAALRRYVSRHRR